MRTPKYTTGVVCLSIAVTIAIVALKRSDSTLPQITAKPPGGAEKSSTRQITNRGLRGGLAPIVGQKHGEKRRQTGVENAERETAARAARADENPAAEIFDEFAAWTQEYIARKGKANAALIQAGESLAIQRRAALSELIQSDPELALEMALPATVRHEMPASISQHLEKRVAGKGNLEVIATVLAPGEEAAESSIARVAAFGDRRFKAFVYGRRLNQTSMEGISMHGIAVGDSMAVDESPVRVLEPVELEGLPVAADGGACPVSNAAGNSSVAVQAGDEVFYLCNEGHIVPLAAAYRAAEESASALRAAGMTPMAAAGINPWTQGERKVVVLRVNFPDDLEEPISETAAETLMRDVESFLEANSYETLQLTTTISPVLTLPTSKSWYATSDEVTVTLPTILREARAAAVAAGLPEADFEIVYVKSGVLSNSRAYVGTNGAWVQSNNASIVAHELGHNLGLWHANAWRTTDGSTIGPGTTIEYGNGLDTMGSGFGHFNTYHKNKLQWLPGSAVQMIESSGIYTLFPADVSSLQEGAAYALKLRKDSSRDYWIETGLTLDGGLLVNWSEYPGSLGGSQLLDMTPSTRNFYDAALKPGEAFYDPALGIKIVPLGPSTADRNAVDVMVTFVHYGPIEAETAMIGSGGTRAQDPMASQGAYIVLPESPRGEARFAINVPESGEYVIWARVRRNSGGPAQVSVAFDNAAVIPAMLETSSSGEWQWSRISVPAGGSLFSAKAFPLSSGGHTLRLAASDAESMIDILLVTNDPAVDLPPVISPISNQFSAAGAPIRASFSINQIGGNQSNVRLEAKSSNQGLVADSRIVLTGSGMTRTLEITPSRNQFGTGTIQITAIDSAGKSTTVSFSVRVAGPVQELVERAAPGDTIILPEGTYIDQVIIDRDLTLVGTGTRETIIDGNRSYVPLTVTSNATVVVRNLTLRRGKTIRNYGMLTLIDCSIEENVGSGHGGGIWNGSSGKLLLQGSTVSGNRIQGLGGGIYNAGELILLNSTISGNDATSKYSMSGGGGIYNEGILQVQNSTITANHGGTGGGLVNKGVAYLRSTILAGNIAVSGTAADGQGGVYLGGAQPRAEDR